MNDENTGYVQKRPSDSEIIALTEELEQIDIDIKKLEQRKLEIFNQNKKWVFELLKNK